MALTSVRQLPAKQIVTSSIASAITPHQFGKQIRSILKLQVPPIIGLAVSGGVDSMALTYLSKQYFQNYNTKVIAFTVDHGARPESATEAAITVKGNVNSVNIDHEVLSISWPDGDVPQEKFEAIARAQRHKVLSEACRERGIKHLLLAHTLDDQMETFLMRLCRGSSTYGLAAMKEISYSTQIMDPGQESLGGVHLVRPLLKYRKEELQQTCLSNHIKWIEDPTNHDPTFTVRNSIRKLLSTPENLPSALQPDSLSNTINILSQSRNDIEKEAQQTLQFLINRKLVYIDPELGIGSLTEFEGFNNLRLSVKTLIFMYIMRLISPIPNLDYHLSSIDDFVRKISNISALIRPENFYTSGVRITVYPVKHLKEISSNELEQQQLFTESDNQTTSLPQKYTLWRQRIHRKDQHKITLINIPSEILEWSTWTLFDNRFWIRVRRNDKTASIPSSSISVRLIYELSPVKEALKDHLKLGKSYKWPFEATLASQPFFMYHDPENPHELTSSHIIGFATIHKYDPILSGVEIQCKLKILDNGLQAASIPTQSL